MRHFLSLLLVFFLVGCANTSSESARALSPPLPSKQFFACFAESQRPWMLNLVAGENPSSARIDSLMLDYVGPVLADQSRARALINDLRQGKYANAQDMAAGHFQACMQRVPAEAFELTKAQSCYKEQRTLFVLQVMRFIDKLSMEDAMESLLKDRTPGLDPSESAIKRLTKDAYTILKQGSESSFSAAQFQVCMTSNL